MAIEPGLAGSADLTVEEGDTAEALRSGDVPVLGTPRIAALMEEATVAALHGHLDPKATTVGMRVQLDHLIPVAIGDKVRADAVLERCEGRRLTFSVSVTGDAGLVAAGKVTRVIVNRAHFMERVS